MISTNQVIPEFRMSAFIALHGLRRYLNSYPEITPHEAAASLRSADADYAAADFDSGIRLHQNLPADIDFTVPSESIRASLAVLITTHLPWWSRFIPYGRQRLAVVLTKDELQTFKSAGLFEEHPSTEIVEWWDAIAAKMRSAHDEKLNAQGRHAEMLSLEYERDRLHSLGISEIPRWTAIEDNGAGYDILSYNSTEYGLKNRLIEVKSSSRIPTSIYLSRGEWETASKYGEAYYFHVWKLPSEELIIISSAEIATHIPNDSGKGQWTEVEIKFDY